MYYNFNDIKKSIENEIKIKEAYLNAWQAVTYPTKKDGSPFANFSKNFNGCTCYKESYASANEQKLQITVNIPYLGYNSDYINLSS